MDEATIGFTDLVRRQHAHVVEELGECRLSVCPTLSSLRPQEKPSINRLGYRTD